MQPRSWEGPRSVHALAGGWLGSCWHLPAWLLALAACLSSEQRWCLGRRHGAAPPQGSQRLPLCHARLWPWALLAPCQTLVLMLMKPQNWRCLSMSTQSRLRLHGCKQMWVCCWACCCCCCRMIPLDIPRRRLPCQGDDAGRAGLPGGSCHENVPRRTAARRRTDRRGWGWPWPCAAAPKPHRCRTLGVVQAVRVTSKSVYCKPLLQATLHARCTSRHSACWHPDLRRTMHP